MKGRTSCWRLSWQFIKQFTERFIADRVTDLSAQIAYYFLLSLFPFLIFTVTLLGYFVSTEAVLTLVKNYVPMESIPLIEKNVRDVLEVDRGSLLSIGIIGTLWSASNATNAIIRAINRAYDVQANRPFWKERSLAIILTLALIFVIWVALVLPVFGREIGMFVFSLLNLSDTWLSIWAFFRWALSFFVLFIVLLFLYYFAPNKKLRMRHVFWGALVATVGWQLVSLAFSYFVGQFSNLSATYGGLAGVIALMIWAYMSGMIMIAGCEVNATLENLRTAGGRGPDRDGDCHTKDDDGGAGDDGDGDGDDDRNGGGDDGNGSGKQGRPKRRIIAKGVR
ncbi:YihY/virulence factor BrkB family protein [Numidum massiliense]|uniref:YihY/virulence factor BrkB family protein n=1 Tax=Numidum massiliense TaxID=1522315 RepID=UPI00093E8E4A|nr:YihY/virulence factor BrkB family protein [Numidum massiliense]